MSEPLTVICPQCQQGMKLVRTIPGDLAWAPLWVFYCQPCGHADTREYQPAGSITKPATPDDVHPSPIDWGALS
jgi:hypothetical protein